ncbi:MAG: hypothetical protein LBN37_08150, partial [Bacteroidales bacterium]|nr:hypothetical protein [Bacteroidales bacterium]
MKNQAQNRLICGFMFCVCLFCAVTETQAQSDITVSTDAGNCSAVVNGLEFIPLVLPAGIVSYTLSGATTTSTNGNTTDASGNVFNKGVTTVKYFDDLVPVHQFTVTVNDEEEPALNNKPAIEIFLRTNGSYILRADTLLNSASDNCVILDTLIKRTDGGNYAKTVTLNCGDADSSVNVTIKLTDVNGNFTEKISLITVKDTISPIVDKKTTLTGYLNGAGEFRLKADTLINSATDNCTSDLRYEVSRNGVIYKDTLLFHCGDTVAAGKAIFVKVTDKSGNTTNWGATIFVKDTISPIVDKITTLTGYLNGAGEFRLKADTLINSATDNCTSDLRYE